MAKKIDEKGIFDHLIFMKFITGLDETMYKDQVSRIYAEEQWPAYTDLIPVLTRYAMATENINVLKKDVGGHIEALRAATCDEVKKHQVHGRKSKKVNKKYACSCYGKKGHHDFTDCKLKERSCNICKKKEHLSRVHHDAEDDENGPDDKTIRWHDSWRI
jgi:hypothetical protein